MNTDQPKPLKPCPFCGKQPRRLHPVCGNGVACDTGECPLRNRIIDAAAWNRRAPENRELREALQEARDQIEYLHREFQPTRTGSIVLGHIDKALAQQPEEKPGQSVPWVPLRTVCNADIARQLLLLQRNHIRAYERLSQTIEGYPVSITVSDPIIDCRALVIIALDVLGIHSTYGSDSWGDLFEAMVIERDQVSDFIATAMSASAGQAGDGDQIEALISNIVDSLRREAQRDKEVVE